MYCIHSSLGLEHDSVSSKCYAFCFKVDIKGSVKARTNPTVGSHLYNMMTNETINLPQLLC